MTATLARLGVLGLLVVLSACGVVNLPRNGEPFDATVIGPPSVSAEHLAEWYAERAPGCYRATVPVLDLARTFIQEGVREGVRGDAAFAQSVLETGWFCWPAHGQVRPGDNNFAGLGATDLGGGTSVARFPTARLGVRAQMQHLRAYADPNAVCGPGCVDPRFDLVRKGTGQRWSQFGNGVWATSTNNYGGRILLLFASMLAYRDAHGG